MKLKNLVFVGSSRKDLIKLPADVCRDIGYGLYQAQKGDQHPDAKVLKGFGGAGVVEIKVSDEAGTYRAVYTVKILDTLFVLHVFQKKSKQGIKTSQADIDLIKSRLKQAEEYKYLKK